MGKRANGEGTVTQRKDGLWTAALTLPNGKRKYYYAKSQAEAVDKLNDAKRDQERGRDLSRKSQTVAAFLTDWLTDVKPSIRPSTYQSYAGHVNNHLIPAFGKIKLDKLSPADVRRMMRDLAAQKLSPRTITYARAVLRQALNQALKDGLVTRNVATLTDPPKAETYHVEPLTAVQARKLITESNKDRLGPLFAVAMMTGLRQGELLALRWQDVDLGGGMLTVRHTLTRVDGKLALTPPKTTKSRRTLNLPAAAVAALKDQRKRQLAERLFAGSRWQGEQWNLVFASTIGTPLNPSNMVHRLQAILKEAKLPRQRFHDLRHCCASLLLAQGVPAKTIMEQLGHSQISLTLNTYAHLTPALLKDAADALDRALGAAL